MRNCLYILLILITEGLSAHSLPSTPAQIIISPNDTICPNDQATLSLLGSTGNVLWSTGSSSSSIMVSPTVTTTYYAIDDLGGQNDTLYATVTVLQISSFIHIHPGGIHCPGDTLSFIHLINPSGSVWWSTGDTSNIVHISPLTTTTYTVINSAGTGCADTVSIIIQVRPPTLPDLSLQSTTNCSGQPAMVTLNNPVGNVLWSTGDTTASVTVWPPAGLFVINDYQGYCPDTGYMNLSGTPEPLRLPNAFSPNHDGDNDAFIVQGPAPEEFLLIIYDRWGRQVFHTNDPAEGWDGVSNSQSLGADVFTWRLRYRSTCSEEYIEQKGNVTLLR